MNHDLCHFFKDSLIFSFFFINVLSLSLDIHLSMLFQCSISDELLYKFSGHYVLFSNVCYLFVSLDVPVFVHNKTNYIAI